MRAAAFALLLAAPLAADTSRHARATQADPAGRGAILLADGSVLVAGGSGVRAAELYDPRRGAWTDAGDMAESRLYHVMVRLSDRRVLAVSGFDGGYRASSELFDPQTRSWKRAADLKIGRAGHDAILLPDGRVLAGGGYGTDFERTTEIYDPRADRWTDGPLMIEGRSGVRFTRLRDGRVLASGGYRNGALDSSEILDPRAGTWTAVATPMKQPRYGHTALLLGDGSVLVLGNGADDRNQGPEEVAERFDPAKGAWKTAASPADPIGGGHAAVLLRDGRVLVCGGRQAPRSAQIYAPAEDRWTRVAEMGEAREYHAAALLADGRVLVAGGRQGKTAEIFDPRSGKWTPAGEMKAFHRHQ